MSEGEPGVAKRVVRTVTPPYFGRSDVEMDVIGWLYFLGLLVLLVPLLPFILALWVADVVARAVAERRERSVERKDERRVVR